MLLTVYAATMLAALGRYRSVNAFPLQKIEKWLHTKLLRRSMLVFLGASCDFRETDSKSKVLTEEFSHGFLVKQSSVLLVNSATTLLSIVASAMIDAEERYTQAMKILLSLLETKKILNLYDKDMSDTWEQVVELKADIEEKKKAWLAAESQMASVANVMDAAAEMAFNAGAEYIGVAANERLRSVLHQLQQAKMHIQQIEIELTRLQAEEIVREADSNEI